MRVMIVGHGAREHAIAARFVSDGHKVIACHAKPNAGLSSVCVQCFAVPDYSAQRVVDIAIKQSIDLLIPTDERALFAGVADAAKHRGVLCVGHVKKTAEAIERHRALVISSMKSVLPARPPRGCIAHCVDDIQREVDAHQKVAVKPLGVNVGELSSQPVSFWTQRDIKVKSSNTNFPVWVEPFIPGRDFSIHYLFISGVGKRLGVTLDYPFLDRGSEVLTGGMGCVSLPDVNDVVSASVIEKCVKMAMGGLDTLQRDEGIELQGFVSFQFRITDRGVIFTEMDCKPGDPEIIALLPGLDGDIYSLLTSKSKRIRYTKSFSIALSMAPNGYPLNRRSVVSLPVATIMESGLFLGESFVAEDGRILGGNSRMVCLVQRASSLVIARASIMTRAVELSNNSGLMYRSDVGDIDIASPSARVRASLSKLKDRGGKRLMLRLTPDAYASVKLLMDKGGFKTETAAINSALIAQAKMVVS